MRNVDWCSHCSLWKNIDPCQQEQVFPLCLHEQQWHQATLDFRKGNFSTSSANSSFDGDGIFLKKNGASVAIEFGPKLRNYDQVFVYPVVHTKSENLVSLSAKSATLGGG